MTRDGRLLRLGVVTGLGFEARHLERAARRAGNSAVTVGCANANPARARAVAVSLRDSGVAAMASFGVAGGLQPGLEPGTIVISDAVVPVGGERLAADAALVTRLAAPGCVVGTIAGSDRPVGTLGAKSGLHRGLGAAAVDMESHAVAQISGAAGIPFVVVRVIADPAEREIPSAALAAMGNDGTLDIGAVLAALWHDPGQIAGMVQLARDMARASQGLRRGAALLGALRLM